MTRAGRELEDASWSTRIRALTVDVAPSRFRRAVTYDEARRWLNKIGGTWLEAKEPEPPRTRPSVIVSVKSAKGALVQRHALYDDCVEGWERQIEIRRAFVRACEQLKKALS